MFEGGECDAPVGTLEQDVERKGRANLESVLKAMGTSNKCKKAARNAVSTHIGSTSVGGGVNGGLFAMMVPSVTTNVSSFQAGTAVDDSMFEEGCGAIFANAKRIIDSNRRITCTLRNNSTTTTVTAHGRSTVLLHVDDGGACERENIRKMKLFERIALANLPPKHPALRMFTKMNEQSPCGHISVGKAKIIAEGTINMRTINSNIQNIASVLEEDVKEMVKASAEQNVQHEGGIRASSANYKSMISTEIQKVGEDIHDDIVNTLTNTTINASQSSGIVLRAPRIIEVKDSTLRASTVIELMATNMTKNAIDMGRQIATDVLVELSESQKGKTKEEGLDKLLEAGGNANTDLLTAHGKAHSDALSSLNSIPSWVYLAVGGVVLVVLISSVGKGGGSGSSGTDESKPTTVAAQAPTGNGLPGPAGILNTTLAQNPAAQALTNATAAAHSPTGNASTGPTLASIPLAQVVTPKPAIPTTMPKAPMDAYTKSLKMEKKSVARGLYNNVAKGIDSKALKPGEWSGVGQVLWQIPKAVVVAAYFILNWKVARGMWDRIMTIATGDPMQIITTIVFSPFDLLKDLFHIFLVSFIARVISVLLFGAPPSELFQWFPSGFLETFGDILAFFAKIIAGFAGEAVQSAFRGSHLYRGGNGEGLLKHFWIGGIPAAGAIAWDHFYNQGTIIKNYVPHLGDLLWGALKAILRFISFGFIDLDKIGGGFGGMFGF